MTTRIIMRNDGRATAEGETEIFGTNGAQTVTVLDGATVTFRSGFNTGGDTIRINGRASDFTVSISGSNVTFRSTVDNITVVIPIGTTANTIVFDNGDSRSLSLVGGTTPTLGTQTITAAGVAVTAGPGTFSITGAASANEGGVFTYTVTRTDTTSAETLLFSVDGSSNGGIVAPATQGADFSPASGVVTFAAGAATASFTVAVATDGAVEGLEGISVRVVKNGAVVAQTSGTIIDGNAQGQGFTLSTGLDTVVGTVGNDTVTGRISEFSSLDNVSGGTGGTDTLVLTGPLPTDTQAQPGRVLDAAFERTSGIERLVLTGGTNTFAASATLGTLAAIAGLEEVVLGGSGTQIQDVDIRTFNDTLTVTGSARAESVSVDLATAGAKTLNLGDGADTVTVTPATGGGLVQVNFTSTSVGNGTNNPVTIVSANGNVTVNDEGTTLVNANGLGNIFNVVGLAADGTVDTVGQNRGNFSRVELGTGAADRFTLPFNGNFGQGNVYFNLGLGNDFVQLDAEGTERHFVVMGGGDDLLNVQNTFFGAQVVARLGDGNDVAIVGRDLEQFPSFLNNSGSVDIDAGAGDDFISMTNFFNANGLNAFFGKNDTIVGGEGRDTLVANSFDLQFNFRTAPVDANRTVSGIEVLQTGGFLGTITLSNLQAGIEQVNLQFDSLGTLVFDSGARRVQIGTLADNQLRDEFAGGRLVGQLNVIAAGTASTDSIVIANTNGFPGNVVGGVDLNASQRNAFNGQNVLADGFETVTIDTGAASALQTINRLSATGTNANPFGQIAGTVNFVGANSVVVADLQARNVNASGLTGTAGITARTVNGFAANTLNTFIGSSNADFVTLGNGRQNLDLGAGNDVLSITALNDLTNGTSVLNGGAGTDTIRTSLDLAVTLSNANLFNANQTSFEVLELSDRQALAQTDTIRVDNLNVSRVISAGTAGAPAPTPEVVRFTFNGTSTGADQVVFDGSTVTFAEGDTPAIMAQKFAAALVGGTTNWTVANDNGTIVLTNRGTGNVADLTSASFSFNNALTVGAPTVTVAAPTTAGANAIAAVPFSQTIDFTGVSYNVDTGEFSFTPGINTGGLNSFTIEGRNASNAIIRLDISSNVDLNDPDAILALIVNAVQTDAAFNAAYTVSVNNADDTITFVSKGAGPRSELTITDNGNDSDGVGAGVLRGNPAFGAATAGAPAVDAVPEVFTATFAGTTSGRDQVVFDGVTVTFSNGRTAAQAAAEFVAQYTLSTGRTWNAVDNLNGTVTFTSILGGDRADIVSANFNVIDQQGAAIPAVTVGQITQGTTGAPGTIVLQNMTSGDTLELIDGSTGTHEVRILDAGLNTNDVLNVVLTNRFGSSVSYGTVAAANVERVNLNLNDTGPSAATIDNVNLSIAQTGQLFVTGNNGVVINHNAANLTLFDASGVIGNVGDLRSSLGVTFFSQNAQSSNVRIVGGLGNDTFGGTGVNETYDLGRGGSDRVVFNEIRAAQFVGDGRTLNGSDVITGFTGGTTSNGDVLDLVANNVIDGNLNSAAIIFNATASNTGDITLTGNNGNIYLVTDGGATINLANIKDSTAATGQGGEILLGDNVSAYVIHAASATSNSFIVYRVFDGNTANGVVDVRTEILGTVTMTNTFGDLVAGNFTGFAAPASTLTAADVAAAAAPTAGSFGMLENLGSFAIV